MSTPVRSETYLGPLLLGATAISLAVLLVALRLAVVHPAAVPALAGAAAIGIVLIARPWWTLPAFAALTWSAVDGALLGGVPSPVQAGALFLLGVGAVRVARRPEVSLPPLRAAGLLALPVVVSWLAAPDRADLVLIDPLRDLSFLLIGAWCARGPRDVERVLDALVAIGLILGTGAILSVAVGPSALFPIVSEGPGHVRAAGPFGEPNFFALSLAALVPAALALLGRGPGRTALGIAATLALAGGILATGSRGALLAAGLAVVLMTVTGSRRRRIAGLAVVGCVAALMPFFGAQLHGAENRTVSGRATENLIAVAMAEDHPLTGVGPGGYPGLYRDYGRRLGTDPRSNREPHSLPLQIAAEQGLVGVLCTLGALLLLLAALRRAWPEPVTRTLALCLLTYGIGSLFLHGSQLRLPYLLAGLAFAVAGTRPTSDGRRSSP